MAGVVLAVAGLGAFVYGVRVARAQSDYYRLKYGALEDAAPEDKAPVAERAHALYPANYYLCQLMADEFLTQADAGGWTQREARRKAAADWCERGRRLNPYGRELAWTATRLKRLESPEAALAIWEPYVDRVFWEPWNIAALISLQAEAGQVEAARTLLPLLHGWAEYAAAASAIENASR
jgi:hypothetical protein